MMTNVSGACSYPPQDAEPIAIWQLEIEQHQVGSGTSRGSLSRRSRFEDAIASEHYRSRSDHRTSDSPSTI